MHAESSPEPPFRALPSVEDELRAALARLQGRNEDLARQVRELEVQNLGARQARMATLNLLEDTVQARRATEKATDALRASEVRQAFLLKLSDRLREARESKVIPRIAMEMLGAHLRVDAAHYAVVLMDQTTIRVAPGYDEGGIRLGETISITELGETFAAKWRAGELVKVENVTKGTEVPPEEHHHYRRYGIQALISVPLIKGGRLAAAVCIHHSKPRVWSTGETLLVEEVAERIWAAMERMQAEEQVRDVEMALRGSQEHLRLVVENARDYAILSMTMERTIVTWNAGATQILGYSAEEVIGKSADLIFVDEDRADLMPQREVHTALEQGRSSDERWHLRKDGRRFWGSGVMMPMRNNLGEAVGFVKIFRDHTEQMRAKEALEQSLRETELARAQAEAAGKAKDHFLAVLSHELRTPLTPVLLAIRVLLRDSTLSPRAQESLQMIERNIRLEAQFIDDLLDLTRIERGKLEIMRSPVSLHEVLQHALEIMQPDFDAKEQTLDLQLAAEQDVVAADATRLQQVFWNLLKNASKFSPFKSTIHLRTRVEPGVIITEVEDHGIGFSASTAERIFEAFQQASTEVTREFGGLGLGLSISRAAVEAHGGKIFGASLGPGKGATFTVELALLDDADRSALGLS